MRHIVATLIVIGLLVAASDAIDVHGQDACSFVGGFARLRELVGTEKIGACLEDEHFNVENGNAEQRTAGGLLVWRRTDGRIAFTDGYRTWVDGPFGLQQRLNREQFDWEIARQPTDGPLPSVPARRPAAVGSPSGSTPPEAAAYAPNGRWYARQVAPLNRGSIGVFDVATNRQVRVLKVRQHPDGDYGNDLKGLAWSPSSRLLAAMFHHGRGGHISVVDAETGQETGYIPIASWHHTIAFVAEDAIAAGGQTFGLEQREAGVPGGRPRAEVSVPAVR
jgi:hypothetical protein